MFIKLFFKQIEVIEAKPKLRRVGSFQYLNAGARLKHVKLSISINQTLLGFAKDCQITKSTNLLAFN